ncbi:Trophoblast glycoprotein precursor, putative [Pediculus humanus corporis]|uniref:Trophoblast glycoprotein, putative n=1 Tax=Pediculus humanus subsp. corporis TaxID=121224 RepID=E0VTD5_PEDHC|nr:Trophoblast glycoprotein precursor, putative [Pediculus humanus corporis]EEB16641.1 Trophoblast glycoprotein precursor, putative [Pediculus humanus corporis]
MNNIIIYILYVASFSGRVWSYGCDSIFHGKCFCGNLIYQDRVQYVVNCTNTQFTNSSVLEYLPEEVEVLIFTGNSIPELPWNIFGFVRNYSHLRVVDMSNNKIKEIFGKSYHRVSTVERLILNHNDISISSGKNYNHHHPRVFSNFENLKELHLTNAFSDTSENLASDLHDIFVNSNLTKLIKLHLEQNKITEFGDKRVFCDLPSIMDLYLGDNLLTGINFEITCLKHLRYIDLENNRIKVLSPRELKIFDSFPERNQSLTLDLHNNPYTCECGSNELFDWLRTTKVEVRRKNQIRCYHEPLSTTNKKSECLFDLVKTFSPPPIPTGPPQSTPQYQATEILLGLLLIILIVLLLGLLYANRKTIRYNMNPILSSVSKKVHYVSIGHSEEQEVDKIQK